MFWQENNTFNALPLLASLQMADMVKGKPLPRGQAGCPACHPHPTPTKRLVEKNGAVGAGKAILLAGPGQKVGLLCGSQGFFLPIPLPGPLVPLLSHKPPLLWAELKKAVAQQPRGLKTLAEAFPDWEAAYRWSQALEKVENSSRPYLKEVQRYEKYRCSGPLGWGWPLGHQADSSPCQPLAVLSLRLL